MAGGLVKSGWDAVCLVLCAAVIGAYCGGCAAAKSSINEFNRMEVGGGPGASLIQLTELQKTGIGKRNTAPSRKTDVAATPVSEKNAAPSVPADSERTVPRNPDPLPATTKQDPPVKPGTSAAPSSARPVPALPAGSAKRETSAVPNPAGASTFPGTSSTASLAPDVPTTVLPLPRIDVTLPVLQEPSVGLAGPSGEDYSGGPRYRIGPEDVIRISVWENKELTLDVMVRPDGKISVPLIQDVQAEGLTAGELADLIERKLMVYVKDPHVSIIVLQVNATKFFVMGYVKSPGTYPLRGDVSVLQALSLAGGFTEFASPRRIRLVRKSGNRQEVRVINYYDLIGGGGEGNYLLRPGDTIVVP